MADKKGNTLLSCAYCHRQFLYRELVTEPSYNGKWICYRTPCRCRTEAWSAVRDIGYFGKFIKQLEDSQRR